jgi:PKD repeat protein
MGTVIGHTTYDLQSNSADPQRIVLESNGNVAVTWTGAGILDINPADRGTYYQYFDGTNWLPEPTTRIEHVRTGWPSNVIVDGKELIYAHDPATSSMVRMSRAAIGSGSWNVETNTGLNGTWPRLASTGDNDTAHLIFANYVGSAGNSFLLYNRTPDAGASIDYAHRRLPGVDTAGGYNIMGGDAYAIAARGNRVAIVAGTMVNDLAVWISEDRGDTWTRFRILDFPIDNFDGNVITDINGDLIADTIVTNDGGHTILIDKDNKVHVWTGRMRMMDDTPADDQWSYFPGTAGLWYWSEYMGEDSIVFLTSVLDLDNSGDLNGIGASIPLYEVSLSGMPTAACDYSTGRIFLVYAAMVEFSDYLGDPADPAAQSFRDLYGMYTDDNGETWTQPVNLTNSALQFNENVYPTAAREANGSVHVQWQRDEEPGTAYGSTPDPAVISEIVYHAFGYGDFEPLPPECDFTMEHTFWGHAYFTDASIRPGTWEWDFGDASANSTEQSPYHFYSANGSYQVCLTVENSFGNDQCCQTLLIDNFGVATIPGGGEIAIHPNPVSGPLTILFKDVRFGEAHVGMYDMVGRLVYGETVSGIDGRAHHVIETSALSTGTYTVRIGFDGGVVGDQVEVIR